MEQKKLVVCRPPRISSDRSADRYRRRCEAQSLVRIARDLLEEAKSLTFDVLTPDEAQYLRQVIDRSNAIWEKLRDR